MSTVTDRSGAFGIRLLALGQYDLRVERLGYNPAIVQGVRVEEHGAGTIAVTLTRTHGAEVRIDTMGVLSPTRSPPRLYPSTPVTGSWFGTLPGRRRDLSDLARFSGITDASLALEGLPASTSAFAIDGFSGLSIDVPGTRASQRYPVVPFSAWEAAEVGINPLDAGWSGFTSGVWSLRSRPAQTGWTARTLASWTPNAGGARPGVGGGVVAGGSLQKDTLSLTLALEGWQSPAGVLHPLGPYAPQADALVSVARDRLGVDLARLRDPAPRDTRSVSGFSRLDWRVSPAHLLTSRLLASSAAPVGEALSASAEASSAARRTDLFSATSLSSDLGPRLGNELRLGIWRSVWTSRIGPADAALPWPSLRTSVVDAYASIGADPLAPESVDRAGVEVSNVLSFHTGAHHIKFGASAGWTQTEYQARPGLLGDLRFGGIDDFGLGRGFLVRTGSDGDRYPIRSSNLAAYAQDAWEVGGGLSILAGLRGEVEVRNLENLVPAAEWTRLTGRTPAQLAGQEVKLSPRAGLRWTIDRRGQWALEGGGGYYYESLNPALLYELARTSDGLPVWQWSGSLPAWPVLPDTASGIGGVSRLVLGGDLRAPRTRRFSAGLIHTSPAFGRAEIFGVYRYTDRLARRHDLNLLPDPSHYDQYGRPIFGLLVQHGTIVGAEPGSNRRFASFEEVGEYRSDGWSEYRAIGVRLEHAWEPSLRVAASYVISRTEDNRILDEITSAPLLAPRVDSNSQQWERGTSQFDVPHRAALFAEARVPGSPGVTLGGILRYQSGHAFTPGVRPGVDLNADGAANNDPAVLDSSIPGFDEIASRWSCLQEESTFAARNSCRGEGWIEVDVRAGMLVHLAGFRTAELYIEGLNLLQESGGRPDAALFEIDPERHLSVDGTTASIPLRINPAFGSQLPGTLLPREIRLGISLQYR